MDEKKALAGLRRRAEQARAASTAQTRVVVTRTTAEADTSGDTAPASPTAGSAELWLYGTVGGYWWGFNADDVAAELRALGAVHTLLVRLHSFGGSAIDGIAIANLIANHPAGSTTVVVDGLAASAASLIALAGDELVMAPGSQLMIHDAWMVTAGNAAELRAEADWIDKQSQNYAETYAHRAGGTADEWRAVMVANNGDGTWYSAQEAVDAGLADRVANIASTSPPPPIPDPAEAAADPSLAAAAEWDLAALIHPAARAAWNARLSGAPKPPTASAGGSPTTEGGSAVAFSDAQLTTMRQKLGIAEDADEATILAAFEEALDEQASADSASVVVPPAAAAGIPTGHVVIPAAKLADLEASAKLAQETAKTLHQRERKAFLDQNRAKYLPTSRAGWEAEYDRDPAGVREHFAKAPDLIPVSELGHELTDEGASRSRDDDKAYTDIYGTEG